MNKDKALKESNTTFLMAAGDRIRDHDWFGHEIGLNFEREGDSFKTIIGGFFSILLKMFLLAYGFIVFKRLIFFERDTNFTTIGATNMGDKVDYLTSNLTIFHVLRK